MNNDYGIQRIYDKIDLPSNNVTYSDLLVYLYSKSSRLNELP